MRRSYLQFLFSLLDLSFLPTYNDFQAKVKYRIDDKNQITFLGLGAIDNFKLNLDANETELQRYQLRLLPVNEQWNYSIGAKYTHFGEKSYTNYILSRFMLNNTAEKFLNNDPDDVQLLDYTSREIENKLRIEHILRGEDWRWTAGLGLEEAKYNTRTLDRRVPDGFPDLSYQSDLRFFKYSLFGQATRSFWNEKLSLTLGLRADANTFNEEMANPLNQLSPKVAVSYNFTSEWSWNSSYGIYYQLPPYPTLGYRDAAGSLVNTDLSYIRATHYVTGITHYLPFSAKVSLEGFYKLYARYPFMLRDSITLANLGSDFGVIGIGEATSTSAGQAYGLELLYQQKLYKGWFGTLAYTWVRSEFEDKNGDLTPSSWDNGHIITLTMGKKLKKNWEIGIQYQYLGGAPYTPLDLQTSSLVNVYDVNQQGLPDYDRLNTQRLASFNRLNLRIDKKWFFTRWSLDVYLDVQNALAQSIQGNPVLLLDLDANGNPVTYTDNGREYYRTKTVEDETGTLIPSIGLIVEF